MGGIFLVNENLHRKEELRGKNWVATFSAVFFLSILREIFSRFPTFLTRYFHEQGNIYGFYSLIASIIIHFASILFVLAGVYLAGRNIDLRVELHRAVVLLLVGAYVGNFVGWTLSLIIFVQPHDLLSSIVAGLFSTSFLLTFFVAFTALSLAYIRTSRS